MTGYLFVIAAWPLDHTNKEPCPLWFGPAVNCAPRRAPSLNRL